MSLLDPNITDVIVTNVDGKASIKSNIATPVAIQSGIAWVMNEKQPTIHYFEVVIAQMQDTVTVGLASQGHPTNIVPGSQGSFPCYVYNNSGARQIAGAVYTGWPKFQKNDIVGVGMKVATGEVFCTLNGTFLGLLANVQNQPLFPIIGVTKPAEVTVFFSKPYYKFDPSSLNVTISPIFISNIIIAPLNNPKAPYAVYKLSLDAPLTILRSEYRKQTSAAIGFQLNGIPIPESQEPFVLIRECAQAHETGFLVLFK